MKAVLALAVLAVIATVGDSSAITGFFDEPSLNEPSINDPSINEPLINDVCLNYQPIFDPSANDLSASDRSAQGDLIVGSVGARNMLLGSFTVFRGAIANAVQWEDRRYTAVNPNHRFTTIQVAVVGTPQGATARIVAGGINQNFVTIRFTSALGRGYHFQVSIWGR